VSTAVAERAWSVEVPHHARGARLARHRLAAALHGLVSADRLADAIAVAAELVTNAVRHAAPLPGGVIRVAWRLLQNSRVEIRVSDGGSVSPPAARRAQPDAVDGRGLTIVEALAARWGVERETTGQCVWAELS
jgi:anti-sigma regulatory factor (Ser/Thr protein kinase)